MSARCSVQPRPLTSHLTLPSTPSLSPPFALGGHRQPQWLKEIKKLQRTTHLLIPKAAFRRLVMGVRARVQLELHPSPRVRFILVAAMLQTVNFVHSEPLRWGEKALLALQEATEDFIIHLLEDCNLCAIHAHRVTVLPQVSPAPPRCRTFYCAKPPVC